MTRNPSSKHVSLSRVHVRSLCKVRQVASRNALKSQNLRGRGKDLHSMLETKFQSSPQKPTSLPTTSQPSTGSRETTTGLPQRPSLYSVFAVMLLSTLLPTATNPRTTVHGGVHMQQQCWRALLPSVRPVIGPAPDDSSLQRS